MTENAGSLAAVADTLRESLGGFTTDPQHGPEKSDPAVVAESDD